MGNGAGVPVPFDQSDLRRLAGMGLFTQSLLRRDGSIPIIGDDDSGRFVRLGCGVVPYADLLSHEHLPAAVAALFAGASSGGGDTPESAWLREWVGQAALPRPPDLLPADAPFMAFPHFGLYVWNRGRFRVTLRCGPVGQNGNGGHAHSDQLAITLDVDGRAVVIDPGTGVYTPDPDTRNRFRSAAAHSTIVAPGREPNRWLPGRSGLFAMNDMSRAWMLRSSPDEAEAEHEGFGVKVRRNVRVRETAVEIHDLIPAALEGAFGQFVLAPGIRLSSEGEICRLMLNEGDGSLALHAAGGRLWSGTSVASTHYGSVGNSLRVCVQNSTARFCWESE
jgi:hypothetical protein